MSNSKLVNSVTRATQILEYLALGVNGVTDISDRLNINRSTIHRLLKSLESTGFVMQDPLNRKYYLGHQISRLALSMSETHMSLRIIAFPEIEKLRDIVEESVGLQIRFGIQKTVIEEVPSLHQIRWASGKGFTSPIHIGSAGLVLLAELEKGARVIIVNKIYSSSIGLDLLPTDSQTFLKELEEIRSLGYATSTLMFGTEGVSISVPIKGYACPVALGIIGPKDRFEPKMMSSLDSLKECAAVISGRLSQASQPGDLKP